MSVKHFLGAGFNFPLKVNQEGGTRLSELEENVEQNIRIILGTAPGERPYHPEFGCAINRLLFQPNNYTTAGFAQDYIKEALDCWEPRIKDIEVDARPDSYHENRMDIFIKYTVRSSNNHFNMVYPFYLRREDEI